MQPGIGDQGEGNLGLGSERFGLVRLPVADHNHAGSARPNLIFDGAQLCDLLAAKESPEVANENQHGGASMQIIPKVDLLTLRSQDHHACETRDIHRSSKESDVRAAYQAPHLLQNLGSPLRKQLLRHAGGDGFGTARRPRSGAREQGLTVDSQ